MSSLISKVIIEGFNDAKFEVDFDSEMNIIIGRNGSGKTRFMNTLQSVLNVNPSGIFNSDFCKITILLIEKVTKRQHTIVCKKAFLPNFDARVLFVIDGEEYEKIIPVRAVDTDNFSAMARRKTHEAFEDVKDRMDSIVTVASITVDRDIFTQANDDVRTPSKYQQLPIDDKLGLLMDSLKNYQIKLISKANDELIDFQRRALLLVLWNEQFGDSNTSDSHGTDSRLFPGIEARKATMSMHEIREGLRSAFKAMGALDSSTEERVNAHIDRMIKQRNRLVNPPASSEFDYIEYRILLPTLLRANAMVDLFKETDKKRKSILYPLSLLIETINRYFSDKNAALDDEGNLIINDGRRPSISVRDLSSGEKQILIIFIECLLQFSKSNIFFADEPELSLHVKWQAEIVDDMAKLNPMGQFVIATHSPEVSATRRSPLINMWELTHG